MIIETASPPSVREYQSQAVDELRYVVHEHGSAVYVLPTGAGKTVVAGNIAERATERGNQVLFVVHRRELIDQTIRTLNDFCPGMDIGVEAPGYASMPWAMLQVGSVFTLARREHVARPRLIIMDEAHHVRAATWERVIERWPGVPRLGLTATPQRLDGKGLGAHFAAMVLGPSIHELQNTFDPITGLPYLAPIQVLRVPSSMRRSGMKKDKNGEFRQKDMGERVNERVVGDAVMAYLTYARGKKTIFFGVHRNHSKRVCAGLRAHGVRAEHVDGDDTPARRDRVMSEFKDGAVDFIGNVALIDEGFDAPSCEVVIDAAWTTSVVRYQQRAGRAMRPGVDKVATLLDLVGNSYELGLPDDPREWTLDDGEVAPETETVSVPRTCGNCKAAFRGSVCPWCNTTTPLSEIDEVAVALEIATPKPKRKPATGRRKDLNRELAAAWRSSDPVREVRAIGERRGYKPGWANYILHAKGML